jgi:hypothetical protein
VRRGRVVLQSRITLGAPSREYLVRVFVDVDRRPADVITVYLTSKIAKEPIQNNLNMEGLSATFVEPQRNESCSRYYE